MAQVHVICDFADLHIDQSFEKAVKESLTGTCSAPPAVKIFEEHRYTTNQLLIIELANVELLKRLSTMSWGAQRDFAHSLERLFDRRTDARVEINLPWSDSGKVRRFAVDRTVDSPIGRVREYVIITFTLRPV